MVGIDIVDIERINPTDTFLEKIANSKEIEYIKKAKNESLIRQKTGALFCVKEAVMKALDMGNGSGVVFKDIELSHTDTGKPFVILHGKAKEKFENFYKDKKIEISLSHVSTMATAIAMIV